MEWAVCPSLYLAPFGKMIIMTFVDSPLFATNYLECHYVCVFFFLGHTLLYSGDYSWPWVQEWPLAIFRGYWLHTSLAPYLLYYLFDPYNPNYFERHDVIYHIYLSISLWWHLSFLFLLFLYVYQSWMSHTFYGLKIKYRENKANKVLWSLISPSVCHGDMRILFSSAIKGGLGGK